MSTRDMLKQKPKFGEFDVEEDGTLSLQEQSKFAVYGANGGLSMGVATYKLKDDCVVETITTPVDSKERVVYKDGQHV